MIRLRDAVLLAGTKLRTRKTRTIVTAVLASLLFAGLIFAFTLIKGAVDSYALYSKNSLSQRYVTNVMFYNMAYPDLNSAELIVRAKELNKQIIADKKADARRLGIEYDTADELPVTTNDGQGGSEYLNTSNYAVQQIIQQELAKRETPEQSTKKRAAAYNPVHFYAAKSFGDTNNLTVMKAGRESFDTTTQQATYYTADPLTTLSYLPRTLVEPFLLDGADLTPIKDVTAAIPVIVTYHDAEKALGFESLPKTASNVERLKRIDQVKKQAVNAQITVCYRNDASKQSIEQTKQQITEIEKHAKDSTYQKPSQIYALPDAASCGPAVVAKDTRTTAEKQLAAKQKEFNIKYGIETEPVQRRLTFRIIGLSPDVPDYMSMSTFESLAASIGGTSLMGQWTIPSELVDASLQNSFISQTAGNTAFMSSSNVSNLVEFGTAADAKKFVTEQACTGVDCDSKPSITYFGSNSVLIEDITDGASKILWIAGAIVATIASILMMGMVGRVITDSRRETAVFRAIGAKRNDIRAVYTLYVLGFSSIIAVSAIVLGMLAAWLYSNSVSESLTTSARLMFIESRETALFNLVGFWPQALLLTAGVVLLAGFVSMLLPLARNLARSPLKDMRSE